MSRPPLCITLSNHRNKHKPLILKRRSKMHVMDGAAGMRGGSVRVVPDAPWTADVRGAENLTMEVLFNFTMFCMFIASTGSPFPWRPVKAFSTPKHRGMLSNSVNPLSNITLHEMMDDTCHAHGVRWSGQRLQISAAFTASAAPPGSERHLAARVYWHVNWHLAKQNCAKSSCVIPARHLYRHNILVFFVRMSSAYEQACLHKGWISWEKVQPLCSINFPSWFTSTSENVSCQGLTQYIVQSQEQ